ncbi:hypothetical protein EON65_29265 [archaeon]|nr:MAG: hypothetical protein EON65_29265 [archaeon]
MCFFSFLKLFTDLPLCSIKPLEALQGSELNSVKRLLADEATSLLHGRDCLATIHNTVDSLFVAGSGGMGELESLVKVQLAANDIASGNQAVSVVDLLVKAELTPSKSEARRLIRNGGVKVADKRVTDEYMALVRSDFDDTAKVKLSAGKKKHVLIIWPEDQK